MSNADIKEMLATIEPVLETAHQIVSKLNDGERIQIKKLAQDVGNTLSLDPKEILGFVNHFAHNTKIAYVTRGKNGGVVKGVRPAKVVKAGKKSKKDTSDNMPSTP